MKTRGRYLVMVVLAVGFTNCKTTQKQEAVSSESKQQTAKPVIVDIKSIRIDTTGVGAARKAAADSLYLRIKKTPCYGKCPIYTADIYNSGFTVYKGERFVKNVGTYTGRLSEAELHTIQKMAKTINYFDFDDEYDREVTDLPTTYTTIHANGREKSIKNRAGGPDALKEFEDLVQKTLDGVIWSKKGEGDH